MKSFAFPPLVVLVLQALTATAGYTLSYDSGFAFPTPAGHFYGMQARVGNSMMARCTLRIEADAKARLSAVYTFDEIKLYRLHLSKTRARPGTRPRGSSCKSEPVSGTTDTDIFSQLLDWARLHGATIHPACGVSDSTAGRGLVATATIPAGTTLLRVPSALILRAGEEDAKLASLLALVPAEHWDARLAVKLLATRGDPRWRPYLESLPPLGAAPGPLFFTGAALRALQAGP